MLARLLTYTVRTLLLLAIIFIDISRNVVYGHFILLPEGVTLMTMIAMEEEAVPARLPKPYRQPSGPWQPARRHYDRRITCDTASRGPLRGSNRRGRRMFSRLRRSQDRLTRVRRRLPHPSCSKGGENTRGFRKNRSPSSDHCV